MKVITLNRRARFNYHVLDTIEAGVVLTGDEVKSLRAGHISLVDSYAIAYQGRLQLVNCYIGPYSHAFDKHDRTRRSRTLLLHKKEIDKLIGDISRKGVTLIPLKLYFNNRGYIKIELGISKHKKTIDKRQSIKERDLARETAREIKKR